MIYLDNAATTQPTEEVLAVYHKAQSQLFYNSESLHVGGEQVKAALQQARQYVQHVFQTTKEVRFGTSGSNVNDMAIRLYLDHLTQGTIWVSPYEHPSIAAALERYQNNFKIEIMPLTADGTLDLATWQSRVTAETVLIIAQHVNSETGYQLPIHQIGAIAKQHQIPFHVDGVQAVKKIAPFDMTSCTSYTFSGHKFHGTKGCGVLMIEDAFIHPLNQHYFHETGLRNGTLDVPSILALVQALNISTDIMHLQTLHQYAKARATALGFTALTYNAQAPHILGLLTPKFEGQYIMQMLSNRNICISTGTACGHGIMLSDGLMHKIAAVQGEVDQYLRLSFSCLTTVEEIDQCFDVMKKMIHEGGSE
ncbi:cysteine desulfurase family protein [Staphylococcus lutrae]|uniref:Cysteine desulfurase n=1 Tax=Staphylococcus lutrae TaxID=155085 RepID=A0AAC9WMF5_9STAP|nr:aminotransferase class V-fold PLP-dependent enzyme [Staphylococcus lutrae]ARJ50852.1 cysteine desulfurase [Staphylococcus lutrae]PNZ39839.1 aminotransferase class V-fold PLP-dependent enzyme [Staphylococcus lutrae]